MRLLHIGMSLIRAVLHLGTPKAGKMPYSDLVRGSAIWDITPNMMGPPGVFGKGVYVTGHRDVSFI